MIACRCRLAHWARDRVHGEQIPIEICVQKQARDTAYLYNMMDRGTIEVGKKADINMVNMATIGINHPEHVYDLPVGAPRWAQDVTGYEMTVVDGVPTFINGVHTGALPGKLVRNPLTFAAAQRTDLADIPAWSIRGVEGTSCERTCGSHHNLITRDLSSDGLLVTADLAWVGLDENTLTGGPDDMVYDGADGVCICCLCSIMLLRGIIIASFFFCVGVERASKALEEAAKKKQQASKL